MAGDEQRIKYQGGKAGRARSFAEFVLSLYFIQGRSILEYTAITLEHRLFMAGAMALNIDRHG